MVIFYRILIYCFSVMRIAIDCRMIRCSGIGTFLAGILPYIVNDKRHQFLLIGNPNALELFTKKNCEIIDYSASPFSFKELFLFPIKIINTCDVFFTPNYNIPLGITIPIFSTIHDVLFLDIPNLKGFFGSLIRNLAIKRVIRISDHIFTVSEFSRSRIEYHCPNTKGITVCYNGADGVKDTANVINTPITNESYFLYIGNIKPHKGLNILLDAFEKISKKCNRKLVIVGNQDNFLTSDKQISKRIHELSLRQDIIFTGYVDQTYLINIIKKAYCLIQPSIYEGFGLPPLEAMHLGTPVILSDIIVFKELFSDFPVTFFESENPDSLAQKMLKEYKRIKLNHHLVEKFSYKKTAQIILDKLSTIA